MNDMETERRDEPADGTERGYDRRSLVRIILAEVTLVLLIFVGVAALIRGASAPDPADAAPAAATPTVNLADLPDATADVYRYAADHATQFTEIPCYCGCEKSLGHRNLEDCFVNAAGDWDAHASGCGVCSAEAIAAREQIDADVAISDVRQSIIDRFGPLPAA
jgi:Protein of unknown function with PCYCGC motif